MKIALITNSPAPYRVPIFKKIADELGDNFLVFFGARKEPNRLWDLEELKFNHIFLNENISKKSDGFNYIHNNPDVLPHLKKFNPDIIITTGFNPTHIYGWIYAKIFKKNHISMTDGTVTSERHLSWIHKFVRKIVYKTSQAFIGASKGSKKLFISYGINDNKIFQSHLCIDNTKFCNSIAFEDRKYDLIFSGNFIDIKNPMFFVEVVAKISKKIKNLKVLILGDGPLKNNFLTEMDTLNIYYDYPGFVQQSELPYYYSKSKIFLFTTKHDAWGVVANESLASGTPVIVTPFAGVANDLVIDKYNGFVLDLDSEKWSKNAILLLQNKTKWQNFSNNAIESVKEFSFENATKGILNACKL